VADIPLAGEADAVEDGGGRTVVVGLSGGVDSAVAAMLLKRRGWRVVGLFMKNWEDDDDEEYCSTREDLIDAASVADVIGIDLEAVNFAAEYKDRVFASFLAEYRAGRTPNPDVLCNAEIKFKAFLDHALRLGADRIATGHYAQIREAAGKVQLMKAEDGTKDQSYFLHRLNQAQLARALFPLGHLYKRDVRRMAEEAGLPNHAKKDSTGICFIGERPFREFLNRYLAREPGAIRTDEGRVIGQHIGLAYYTIGQRKGIGIGGVKPEHAGLNRAEEPDAAELGAWYVAAKDMAKNELIVVQGHQHPLLLKSELSAADLSWVSGTAPRTHWVYTAKTRYRQDDAPCDIAEYQGDAMRVEFAEPQWAVTPGQSAVIYESRVCLGGGVII
jgi:tRNA-uridine 2-sulfurtransferase